MSKSQLLIGIDVGGTFTDAVVLDGADGTVLDAFKLPSTPADPGAAVISALARIGEKRDIAGALVCHGTTVGTNTLIERKGAKTALLATRGFTDVIELRRQNRPNLYDLGVRLTKPLVPAELRFGVNERMAAGGEVIQPVAGMANMVQDVKKSGATAVAVCFLHSYVNPENENAVKETLERELPNLFVTTSSDVCPEFREFERTSTTVVNAFVGPVVSRYMKRLSEQSRQMAVADLMIVKSNGGLTSPDNAAAYPVHLIESGPAAGLIATAAYAAKTDRSKIIAFDMGGTTAKAGVVLEHQPKVTDEFLADRLVDGYDVGGYPIRSAVLDIVEIGAGGGSIAWIDDGGVLRVGPESAGADPGPACYSRGGEFATVSDAHAVIGTLNAETFEGSGVTFDRQKAVDIIEAKVAVPMGWSVARAAHAVIDIAVANMAEMVRLATVRRGLDPRDFTILASGGAGPLHASSVGAEVGAREVVIPPLPGMFSALGALLGQIRHDLSKTYLMKFWDVSASTLYDGFEELRNKAEKLLANERTGVGPDRFERFADFRFSGQLFELTVPIGSLDDPLPAIEAIEALFRETYRSEFGFDLTSATVQLVNLRLVATRSVGTSVDSVFDSGDVADKMPGPLRMGTYLAASGDERPLPVFKSKDATGGVLEGPALIEHAGSTVWLRDGQRARVAGDGSIEISVNGEI